MPLNLEPTVFVLPSDPVTISNGFGIFISHGEYGANRDSGFVNVAEDAAGIVVLPDAYVTSDYLALWIRATDGFVEVHGSVHGGALGIVTGERDYLEDFGGIGYEDYVSETDFYEIWSTWTTTDAAILVGDTGSVSANLVAAIQHLPGVSPMGEPTQTGDFSLVNRGEVVAYGADAHGVNLVSGSAVDGFGFSAQTQNIENHGLITALGLGGTAISIGNPAAATRIDNGATGIISSSNAAAISIVGSDASAPGPFDLVLRGGVTLVNDGQIIGGSGPLVDPIAYQSSALAFDSIMNSGVMHGAVFTGLGNDEVTNSGVIDGPVFLGDGADLYRSTGGSAAVVLGEEGDDIFVVEGGTQIIDGGEGLDSLTSFTDVADVRNVESLTLRGNADLFVVADGTNSEITGNAGANDIEAGAGNDTVNGGRGADAIDGGANNDVLRGNAGNDLLIGGSGNDRLIGGLGNDILMAGAGADRLRGGQGADVFVWEARQELGAGARADTISDFQRGLDRIDLSEINESAAFTFLGASAAFTGTGPELIYTGVVGGVLVSLDSDGDGAADADLVVAGVSALTADDFIL